MGKGKLPKAVIADLAGCAEHESKHTKEPAADILKGYIKLMDKYRDYFFDSPWPKEYNFEYSTTFTQTDINFLLAATPEDYCDRLETMCIKKNLYLTGFMAYGKLIWTQQAFEKQLAEAADDP